MENGKMVKWMALVNFNGRNRRINILGSILKIKKMDLEYLNGKMV